MKKVMSAVPKEMNSDLSNSGKNSVFCFLRKFFLFKLAVHNT